MMKFTKEEQIQAIYDLKVGYMLGHDDIAILKSMARQLLAGMEQEPVAWRWRQNESKPWHLTVHSDCAGEVQPLYAAPQLPQPVPDKLLAAMEEVLRISDRDHEAWHRAREGIADYHAAMLGAEPVSQHPDLTVWYGSMPETNGKSNWTAILHRKGECLSKGITVDCSEYPDRVRYEADRVRYLIGELADEPDILAYDADAHSGYAEPVSQPYTLRDGWVAVPVEPTEEILDEFDSIIDYGAEDSKDAWSRLLAAAWIKSLPAAPQQQS